MLSVQLMDFLMITFAMYNIHWTFKTIGKGTGVLSMAKDYWLAFLYFPPDLSEFLILQGICVISRMRK